MKKKKIDMFTFGSRCIFIIGILIVSYDVYLACKRMQSVYLQGYKDGWRDCCRDQKEFK